MNAIILCGGLATRLGDIAKDTPKALLNIKGKSVLEWQFDYFAKIGISQIVLAAGHLSSVIEQKIGSNYRGLKIIYAIEPERLGTGGAIKFARQSIANQNEPTWISNGDQLYDIDFADMQNQLPADSDGIILGLQVPDAAVYGTLEIDKNNKLLSFKEKQGLHAPGLINAGLYFVNQSFFNYFPDTNIFSVEYDVFPNVKNLFVYNSPGTYIDIGVPERLEWARKNWINEDE